MFRKILIIIMCICMIFAFAACGASDNQTTENEGNAKDENTTIDYTSDEDSYHIKYKGWEYAPYGFAMDDDLNEIDDDVILVKFEFTNDSDQPIGMGECFGLSAFQNGEQLDTCNVNAGIVEEVDNFGKQVFDGASVTCAGYWMLKDKSPVTVFVEDYFVMSDNAKQKMVIDLSEKE